MLCCAVGKSLATATNSPIVATETAQKITFYSIQLMTVYMSQKLWALAQTLVKKLLLSQGDNV